MGAVGLTTNLDENTLMIVGSDDVDMALCANVLLEAGRRHGDRRRRRDLGKTGFSLSAGFFRCGRGRKWADGLRRIQHRLKEMGSPFDKPIFALNFLPFVTLPALRITARGLVNAKERRIVSLFAD